MQLKPYQQVAADRISKSYQLILADEMGLGKTAELLRGLWPTFVSYRTRKILVVCPASLKWNWVREIKQWFGPFIAKPDDMRLRIVVTNYERLKNYVDYARKGLFGTVVFDEAHYLKNPKSQRFYYANVIATYAEKRFLLTGTPMVSGPCDLAPLLDILGLLPLFGGYEGFYKRYCNPIWNGYGWDYSGSSNKDELKEKLKKYMIRRTKKECGIKLPPKKIVDVPVVECKQSFAESLQEIEEQTQVVNRLKFPYSIKFIDDLLAKGKRPVVFVHHRDLMRKLAKHYGKKAVKITGGQSMENRQKAIDAFQDEDVPLIFCSLQASATGITLTSSDTAVFLEYLWSPAVSQQAQDRIHRLSQTKPVTIYNLYCPKSIETQKGMRSYAKELDMKGIL